MNARVRPHGDLIEIGFVLMLGSGAIVYGALWALWMWLAG